MSESAEIDWIGSDQDGVELLRGAPIGLPSIEMHAKKRGNQPWPLAKTSTVRLAKFQIDLVVLYPCYRL